MLDERFGTFWFAVALVGAVLLWCVGCAGAHVLTFTPTGSIGAHEWGGSPVSITFGGAAADVNETYNPFLPPPFRLSGTNNGVSAYTDMLANVTAPPGGLLQIQGSVTYGLLQIDSTSPFVDDVWGMAEIELRGNIEGYGDEGSTLCFGAPFGGVCEAAGYWLLDGAALDPPDPVAEPGSFGIVLMAGLLGLMVRGRRH